MKLEQIAARRLLALVIMVAVVMLGAAPISGSPLPGLRLPAQDGGTLTWSVGPTPSDEQPERPNFSFELEAGAVIEDSIRVRNFGEQPLALDVYASDAVITSTGALDLLPAGEEPSDLGTWIELATNQIDVPAGSSVDVPFTMVVPGNAEPGDHTGGIVTSLRSSATTDDGQEVVLDRRLGNRVLVRVDGELRPALSISEVEVSYDAPLMPFQTGTLDVAFTVTNTGNLRLSATQQVEALGRIGFPGRSQTGDPLPELLPGSSLRVNHQVAAVWPTFRTTARIALQPAPTGPGTSAELAPVTATAATWSMPWGLLAALLAVAAVAGWVVLARRRRARREAAIRAEARAEALGVTGGDGESEDGESEADDADAEASEDEESVSSERL